VLNWYVDINITHPLSGKITMTKGQHSNREAKKEPAKSLKEKRAAKKAKKDTRSTFLESEKK
jgi:hypothetical protein